MKNLKLLTLLFLSTAFVLTGCSSDDNAGGQPDSLEMTENLNDVTLYFDNTFKDEPINLGNTPEQATVNTSTRGQDHYFSELKYIISGIKLVSGNKQFAYHIDDLDKGAFLIDQSKPETSKLVLKDVPTYKYDKIIFDYGIKDTLNTLDQERFPKFYALTSGDKGTGAFDTGKRGEKGAMHWYWGKGYRFTKIEGFFKEEPTSTDWSKLSIHTGSTTDDSKGIDVDAVNGNREIVLDRSFEVTQNESPDIHIKADFNHLLSGTSDLKITADANRFGHWTKIDTDSLFYSKPYVHTADQMYIIINNLGGQAKGYNAEKEDITDTGMFSIE